MEKCPDCDGVKMLSFPEEGDGKCSVCHGGGKGGIMDGIAHGLMWGESICETCNGSGVCQTCQGSGVVE